MAGVSDEAAEPSHAPRATPVAGQAHQQMPDLDGRPAGGGMQQKQQQQQARGDRRC
jgi:hypothetical protein